MSDLLWDLVLLGCTTLDPMEQALFQVSSIRQNQNIISHSKQFKICQNQTEFHNRTVQVFVEIEQNFFTQIRTVGIFVKIKQSFTHDIEIKPGLEFYTKHLTLSLYMLLVTHFTRTLTFTWVASTSNT